MVAVVGWTMLGGSDSGDPAIRTADDYVASLPEDSDSGGASFDDSASETTARVPETRIVYDRVVDVADLPGEAVDTLTLIDSNGPYPFDKDGTTFQNREGRLPDHPRGYYREFTVITPGSPDRGARRIVAGDAGEYYWTGDHYDSFAQIVGW